MSSPSKSADERVITFADCQAYDDNCSLGVYMVEGQEPVWRSELPSFYRCPSADDVCMCPDVGNEIPAPALSDRSLFAIACSSEDLLLVAFDRSTGQLLWRQALAPLNGASSIRMPPAPVYSAEHDLVIAAAYIGGESGSMTARVAHSGKEVWSASLSGHDCYQFTWRKSAAVALSDGLAIFWDSFGIRAVDTATGADVWSTESSDFAVLMGVTSPQVRDGVVVVPVASGRSHRTCDALNYRAQSLLGISTRDGSIVGTAEMPSREASATLSPPVSAGGFWIFGDSHRTQGFRAAATIYGVASPIKALVSV